MNVAGGVRMNGASSRDRFVERKMKALYRL
jgi:hypothetical protein